MEGRDPYFPTHLKPKELNHIPPFGCAAGRAVPRSHGGAPPGLWGLFPSHVSALCCPSKGSNHYRPNASLSGILVVASYCDWVFSRVRGGSSARISLALVFTALEVSNVQEHADSRVSLAEEMVIVGAEVANGDLQEKVSSALTDCGREQMAATDFLAGNKEAESVLEGLGQQEISGGPNLALIDSDTSGKERKVLLWMLVKL